MNLNTENQFKPLVSIGIPTYNRPEGLRRTLVYIEEQTYGNLEIIISDNATPGESTQQVVQEFMAKDDRIRFFRQPINRGATFNFQFVLQQATGSFFMWAADDDEWEPNFIESCLVGFADCGILVCSQMETHWRMTGKIEPMPVPSFHADMLAYDRIRAFLKCPTPSMFYGLYRRRELLKVFDLKNSFDFYDCALLIRILARSPVKILPEVLYRAGIDDSEYIVKSYVVKVKSKLIYLPFLKHSFKTVKNCNMQLRLKTILWLLIVQFVIQNYIHHEKDYAHLSLSGLFKYKIAVFTGVILKIIIK